MFGFFKARRYFIVEEKNVTAILTVINRYYRFYVSQNLAIGNCGWADEPTKWFIHFDASNKQYDNILKDILEKGSIKVDTTPKGKRNLIVEIRP